MAKRPKDMPAQQQDQQPGLESQMTPEPQFEGEEYRGSGKLEGKVALVTGAGRVAVGRGTKGFAHPMATGVAALIDDDELAARPAPVRAKPRRHHSRVALPSRPYPRPTLT